MRIAYRLCVEDYAALVDARGLRRYFGQPPRWLWYGLGAVGVVQGVLTLGPLGGASPVWVAVVPWAVAAFAFAAPSWYWAYLRRVARHHQRNGDEFALTMGDVTILVENGGEKGELPLDAIQRADERRSHVLLWLDRKTAVIVPKRAFAHAEDAENFIARIERRRSAGTGADA